MHRIWTPRPTAVALAALLAPAAIALMGFEANANGTGQLTVETFIDAGCTVSNATLDFGEYTVNQNKDSQAEFNVQCAATGITLTITMGPGNAHDGTNRRMNRSGGGGQLRYQLFKNDIRTQQWADGMSTHSVQVNQANTLIPVTVWGRVLGNQDGIPHPAGNYSDSVLITITPNIS